MWESWEAARARGRRWPLVVGVVAAVVVGSWAARSGLDTGEDGSLRVQHDVRGDNAAPATPLEELPVWTDLEEVRGEWTRLEDAPIALAREHLGVWTGAELVVGFQPEVAAYDPAAGRWRQLPSVPGPVRADPRVAWTGDEVVVFGGTTDEDAAGYRSDGLLLDVAGEQWRELPAAPAAPLWDPTVVWTGREVIVWGGARSGDAYELGEWPVRGSAYDPQEGRWRVLADAPVAGVYHSEGVWAGREMVVWGSHHPPGQQLRDEAGPSFAAAYDPTSDTWRRLAAPPFQDAARAAGIWTGRSVMLWGKPPARPSTDRPVPQVIGAAWNPLAAEDQGWWLLPVLDVGQDPTAIGDLTATWTSVGAVFSGGYPESDGLVYDPEGQAWRGRLPSLEARVNAAASWTGTELLVWGGYTTTGPDVALWAFRPTGGPGAVCPDRAAAPPDAPLPAGWSWSPSPLTAAPAVVAWTGTDIVMAARRQGATVDPATKAPRCLPASPLDLGEKAGGVWTPAGLFVWGGDPPAADAALYDPVARTWRSLPRPPLSPREPLAVVWTGEEVLVWGDTDRGGGRVDGAAYNPAADTWRELPDAPVALNQGDAVWTGEEMIVYGAMLDHNNAADSTRAVGIAYSPDTDAWRRLPDHPLSPQASAIAWTGSLMFAWDHELNAAVYDPATDVWTPQPRPPFEETECRPASANVGGRLFASYCGQAALFDHPTRTWTSIDMPAGLAQTPLHSVEAAAAYLNEKGLWLYQPDGWPPQEPVPTAARLPDHRQHPTSAAQYPPG